MAKVNDGQTLRDYGNRMKRYRRIRKLLFGMILVAIIIAVSFYLYLLNNKDYQDYEVVHSESMITENASGYLSYLGGVVKYSKDGAVAVDKEGNLLWNGSYEMMDPIADVCDKYVVVADRRNKLIHIFNEKGFVSSITTLYDIVKVEVASQGVVAVLLESGDSNFVKLYYEDGTVVSDSNEDGVLAEIITQVGKAGYPVDIALSKDGKKLVVSFLSFHSGKLISTIGFYNFGEVGQNYTDRLVGGFEYEEVIIPEVAFLGNDMVCIYKDNGFDLFSMAEKPALVHEEELDRQIQSVFYNEKYTGIVLAGTNENPQQIQLYDLQGKKVLEKVIDFEYDKIFISDEEIIMHDNLSCLILKTNGSKKFEYTFDTNIHAFFPINHLDKYYLVNTSEIRKIMLVE
ncbi:MAG: hypothetical protein GX306_05655 [Clostridiales bacterium]|nr:hypothetical protein [Clostridiales bacterium]